MYLKYPYLSSPTVLNAVEEYPVHKTPIMVRPTPRTIPETSSLPNCGLQTSLGFFETGRFVNGINHI